MLWNNTTCCIYCPEPRHHTSRPPCWLSVFELVPIETSPLIWHLDCVCVCVCVCVGRQQKRQDDKCGCPSRWWWLMALCVLRVPIRYLIPSLDRAHAGHYRCIVRNRVGAIMQCSTEVQVACKCGLVFLQFWRRKGRTMFLLKACHAQYVDESLRVKELRFWKGGNNDNSSFSSALLLACFSTALATFSSPGVNI